MIHDQDLVDQLSALTVEQFDGEVFRATGVSANPLAFSLNGGRWAPAALGGADIPVLYTSMEHDGARYGERDYGQTQRIGAALSFLGLDGLIAPSARWRCDNLMIYQTNHLLNERLDVIEEQHIDWQAWARANDFIDDT